VDAFTAAQKAWVVFRDAHVKSVYPEHPGTNILDVYGRLLPACSCILLDEMTQARSKELRKRWIEGTAEDDACAGSSARRHEAQDQQIPKHKQ
jgi:hypothetical protein